MVLLFPGGGREGRVTPIIGPERLSAAERVMFPGVLSLNQNIEFYYLAPGTGCVFGHEAFTCKQR